MTEFRAFPKIARLNRDCIITEKIDGTNGCIVIERYDETGTGDSVHYTVSAQSRNRNITPEQDNAGFAQWVEDHSEELLADLGPGYHYGEWWGAGVQRRYGLDHKRFSLFNTTRWADVEFQTPNLYVVPVLYEGPFITTQAQYELDTLRMFGSIAAPGFMKPEGIVVYHTAANALFKATIENDDKPKGVAA